VAAARTSGGGGSSEVGQPRACAMALSTRLLESSLANRGFGMPTETGGGACTGGRSERGGIARGMEEPRSGDQPRCARWGVARKTSFQTLRSDMLDPVEGHASVSCL